MSDTTDTRPKKGSINDLGLSNDALEGADFESIPENLGQSYPDPPQPGKYRFQLPGPAMMAAIWTVVESKHGTRINAVFDAESPLMIVQSPNKEYDGTEFPYRISNVPRERTKEKILVSDMDLLLRALGESKRPPTNKGYAQALQKYAGREFGATVEFSYRCSDQREAYFDDGAGGQQRVEGRMGCGSRWYQRDIPKVDGLQPVRITCSNPECGASVRAFPNLTAFTK